MTSELVRVFGSHCCDCHTFFLSHCPQKLTNRCRWTRIWNWFFAYSVTTLLRLRSQHVLLIVSHIKYSIVCVSIDVNMIRPLEMHTAARGYPSTCPWMWSGPILQRSLSPMPGWKMCQRYCIPTRNTESENTCTSVLNRFRQWRLHTSDINLSPTILFAMALLLSWMQLPKNYAATFCEVLKSGLHSFYDRLCFVNLMIHPEISWIFHLLHWGKKTAHIQSFMNMLQIASPKGKLSQFWKKFPKLWCEYMFWMMSSFQIFIFITECSRIQSMDLLEI